MLTRWLSICLAVMFALPAGVWACPFCGAQGQTLAGEVAQADLIVVGVLRNPRRNVDDTGRDITELHITSIIKDHPYLAGRKVVLLPHYRNPDDPDAKVMVFAGVYPPLKQNAQAALVSGALLADFSQHIFDPYRGDPIGTKGELADYLQGAIAARDKPVPQRLRYHFDYLDSHDLSISSDAFLEFGNAEYKDVKELAPTLPADKILGWLRDKSTPPAHVGLYGLLIGHCGKRTDAAAIREILDSEPNKLYSSGMDGLMAGYILLDPDEGWKFLTGIVEDPASEFTVRYAALRTLRFFWEYRPDVVPMDRLKALYGTFLSQVDIADMAIEDMRKWKSVAMNEQIVALGKLPSHLDSTFIRRALIKYLLTTAAGESSAQALLNDLRAKMPDAVKAAEESVQNEIPIGDPPK